MKITAVRATPINLPIEAPYWWSFGWLPGSSRCIVEVETDEGLTGIGEAASWMACDIIHRRLAPALIGRDPIDVAGAELRCLPSWRGVSSSIDFGLIRAFAAIETALWDIRGKAWGRPLYDLLGGAVRTEIAFCDYFGFRQERDGKGGELTPVAVADYCMACTKRMARPTSKASSARAIPRPASP